MKRIALLGSTGSIGRNVLEVVRALPGRFEVVGLAAGQNTKLLADQVREFRPDLISSDVPDMAPELLNYGGTRVSMVEMVQSADIDLVIVGTVGRAGLTPTIEAVRLGKSVAIANKEVIVMAGELLTALAQEFSASLLPVDSEPSAIWQCIQGENQPIKKLIITASGGPFRGMRLEDLIEMSAVRALAHPTWSMGNKITIDSATLMNKGFEVIESHLLFGVPFDQIDVVVHPQSIIHSMVEFADRSVKAQMGVPDMKLPIQYAMLYPDRISNPSLKQFTPLDYPSLTFEPLDRNLYPCFDLALEVGKTGGLYPAVLAAADEEAVNLFLDGKIKFTDIHSLVRKTIETFESSAPLSIDAILVSDQWAREKLLQFAGGL